LVGPAKELRAEVGDDGRFVADTAGSVGPDEDVRADVGDDGRFVADPAGLVGPAEDAEDVRAEVGEDGRFVAVRPVLDASLASAVHSVVSLRDCWEDSVSSARGGGGDGGISGIVRYRIDG
jgi:hypothetical protein